LGGTGVVLSDLGCFGPHGAMAKSTGLASADAGHSNSSMLEGALEDYTEWSRRLSKDDLIVRVSVARVPDAGGFRLLAVAGRALLVSGVPGGLVGRCARGAKAYDAAEHG
jgi:hypothetical protein